jgi:hypothetical protein
MTEPRDDAPDGLPDTTEPAAPEPDPEPAAPEPDPEPAAPEPDPEPAAPEPEPDTELADDIDAASSDEAIDVEDDVSTEVLAAGAAAAAPAPTIPTIPEGRRRGATQPAIAAVPEPAIRIKDRASSLFVIITVAAFVLIFLNAILLGNGGVFNPYVAPTEPPTPSIVASPSAAGSAAPSGSASPSGSVAPSGSAAPSPSAAPSVSPSPS